MTALGAKAKGTSNANAWNRRPVEMEYSKVSTNTFLMDVRDTDMDPVNHMDGRYADGTNPFVASMELTLAADGGMVHGLTPSLDPALPPTPPPSRLTNPFLTPLEYKANGESKYFNRQTCDCSKHMVANPVAALPYGSENSPGQMFAPHAAYQLSNPFTPVNCTAQNPSARPMYCSPSSHQHLFHPLCPSPWNIVE